MQDRPTIDELLAAVEHFLDTEIVPNVPGARGFHGRVAANAIRIVRRELEREDEQLAAEWAGLDAILGPSERPADRKTLRTALRDRNEALCSLIRNGAADDGDPAARVQEHVRNVVRDKLRVTDPELLSRSGDTGQ
jgi:hypothetical protein